MNVTLPDGTVIQNVPDGTSRADLIAKLKSNGHDTSTLEAAPAAAPAPGAPRQYDPSAGGSTLNLAGFDTGIPTSQGVDRFLSGAGAAVAGAGQRVSQLFGGATAADVDETKRQNAPLMSTGAGITGNIAGNVGMFAVPGSIVSKVAAPLGLARTAAAGQAFVNPATLTGATAAGATQGFMQPVGTGDSSAFNTILGGAAGAVGQGIVSGLGAIAAPIGNKLSELAAPAVQTLRAAGVPLSLSQITGSPLWNRISSSLSDNLFTLGGQAALKDSQGSAYTRAVGKTFGADAPALTGDVMGPAADRINGVFGDVLNRNNVTLTPGGSSRLAAAQSGALEGEKAPVAAVINRIFDAADPQTGQIPGQVAYGIKKDLDRYASSNDTTLAYFARQARSALMDEINGSLSGADKDAFTQARQQFSNMKRVEPAIANDGSGQVSPNRLASVMAQKANRGASVYGKGDQDLVELAQAGKQVLPDQTNNSGTTARLIAALAPGAAVGLGTQFATGDPVEAAKYGFGTMALPKMAQWVLNSPAAMGDGLLPSLQRGLGGYLADGLSNPTARNVLQLPATNALVGQTVRNAPNALARLAMPDSLTMPTMVIHGNGGR